MQKETIYFLKAENGVEVKRRAGGIDSYPVLDLSNFCWGGRDAEGVEGFRTLEATD